MSSSDFKVRIFALVFSFALLSTGIVAKPANSAYDSSANQIDQNYINSIRTAINIDFSRYDVLTHAETKADNKALQKTYDRFRVVYNPDRTKAVEYYTDANGNEEITRQVWKDKKVEMYGTKKDKYYWYMFHNPTNNSTLFCIRTKPISEKDIIKGNPLKSSAKDCNDIYYQYHCDNMDLVGTASPSIFSSGIILARSSSLNFYDSVYFLNTSDLGLSKFDIKDAALSHKYSTLFTEKVRPKDGLRLGWRAPQLPMIMSITERLKKEADEKARLNRIEKEKAEKAAREKERADYRAAHGITKEYLTKYTEAQRYLQIELHNRYYHLPYFVSYYYLNSDGHLIKATFLTDGNMFKMNETSDKLLPDNVNLNKYLSYDDLLKQQDIEIMDMDTGSSLYSTAGIKQEEQDRLAKQREAEKAAKEREKKLRIQKLNRKYGAKYVTAALDGEIMIGMPLALIKEVKEWFSLAVDSESTYTSYYYLYRERYTHLGSFTLKYAYIGVKNGKISYIRYIKY